MANIINFNPQLTTSPANTFLLQTEGYVQGAFFSDNPADRLSLSAGTIASTVTGSIWGGMALTEGVNLPGANQGGNPLTLAVSNATITGYSVFNQAHNMIIVPGNSVQQAVAGMSMSYFRTGSLVEVAVQCDPTLANSAYVGNVAQQVSWDFVNHMLVPYTPGYAANTITGAAWAATSGGQISFTVSTDPRTLVFAGDRILTTTVVNTGGASTGAFNGDWTVVSTDATHIVVSAPAAATLGTYASGGSVTAASAGALPVKLLSVNMNSKIVNYNVATGALSWTTGAAAIIQI